MIEQFRFALLTGEEDPLPSFWAYRLYAWLLQQIPSEQGDLLHEQGETPIAQYISWDPASQTNFWTVTLLSDEMAALLGDICSGLEAISLRHGWLGAQLQAVERIESAEALILSARQEPLHTRSEIRLLTPTAFKQHGRYVIFPEERLVLQSLIGRWNRAFPAFSLADEDALRALEAGLHITDYALRTTRYPLKGVKIPGCYGRFIVEARLSPPLMEIWRLLLSFAPFAGIGIKTTLGMGGVACGQI